MDAHKLAKLLLAEPNGTDVQIVDQYDQAYSHGFTYCSRVTGVTQLPVKLVMLIPVEQMRDV
jgi:hypothetical protein